MKTVIIDNLEWQYDDDGVKRTWSEAVEYAKSLGEGWRLPTIQELLTLVDYNYADPACTELLKCKSDFYWSSTVTHLSFGVWGVNFYSGCSSWGHKDSFGPARYVRSVQ